jgi:hypothetical protein
MQRTAGGIDAVTDHMTAAPPVIGNRTSMLARRPAAHILAIAIRGLTWHVFLVKFSPGGSGGATESAITAGSRPLYPR